MPTFIKVRTREGMRWINFDKVEIIIPKNKTSNLRMDGKLFIEVAESVEDILKLIKEAGG